MLPPVIEPLFRLLWRTCPIETVEGRSHLEAALADDGAIIPCYWHQQQLFCARYLIEEARQRDNLTLAWLVSPSNDGNMASRLLEKEGVVPIRGSAARGGAQAMRELYLAVRRQGLSPVITPDGPKGPVFQSKSGVIGIAKLTGAPLLPLAAGMASGMELRSWDRFQLPRPGSRMSIVIGEPLDIARDTDETMLATAARELDERLNRASDRARELAGRSKT
ncbi:MAG: hypothetical protein CSB44_09775 [Gammaproteobacteria bacterium]|nr:MAG: hypothetical protein CSB44_09775 [Gammaproteobacteria bacterium]PIE36356.1 MAG: hypothetical protein CSA54_04670 [Gammaproteobacteria bacterium]